MQHEPLVQFALRPSQPLGAGSQRPVVPRRIPRQHVAVALHVSFKPPHVVGARQVEFTQTSDEQQAALAQEAPEAWQVGAPVLHCPLLQ